MDASAHGRRVLRANGETRTTTTTRTTTPTTDAYRVARELVAWAARARPRLRGLPGEAGPQLERALTSALLNVAEAAGRTGARDQARVFAIARGEACEAAAALDVVALYGALGAEAVRGRAAGWSGSRRCCRRSPARADHATASV